MGFWDFLKQMGSSMANKMQENMAKVEQYRDEGEGLSDQELIRKIKNSSGLRQQGYIVAAKRRGLMNN